LIKKVHMHVFTTGEGNLTMTTLSASGPASARIFSKPVLAIAVLWLAGAIGLGSQGLFVPRGDAPPMMILIAVLGPPALFLLAYRASAGLRAWVEGLDLAAVLAVQGWRAAGALFLPLWIFGFLPAAFALPAGVGDLAVGMAAPFVAVLVARQAAGAHRAAYALTFAGLADFVVAVGTGVLTREASWLLLPGEAGSDLMNQLPLSLIPTFLVPLFLIAHIVAFIKLKQH
jgi:hypothetical protein